MQIKNARRRLRQHIHPLQDGIARQERLGKTSRDMLIELRAVRSRALRSGSFPVLFCNQWYTNEQLTTQIAMLLSQVKGYQAAAKRLHSVKRGLEHAIEELMSSVSD